MSLILCSAGGPLADHQSIVVEVAGKIAEQSVSFLIDPGSTHNYITPRVVEICAFN